MPGVSNADQVRALVGSSGLLQFIPLDRAKYGYVDPTNGTVAGTLTLPAEGSKFSDAVAKDPTLNQPLFAGDQVDGSKVSAFYDSKANTWAVNLSLKPIGTDAFSKWSSANVGSYFMIVLDNTVESAPYIKSAITDGTAEISGNFTVDSAKLLANQLQYGALPFPIAEIGIPQNIPATLGKSFLDQTLLAGAIGICLVLLFMVVYYRLPGVVAGLALIYYAIAVLAVFRIIPVTLTLAGIAGFVLSVGMAVDANILIFERTKEELRTGKTLQSAVEAGFNRAWNSIFDSNMSSLITAGILYFFGTATIKGFALVLIVGVATSMFTAVTVSRTLLRVVVRQGFAGKAWLYGVTDEEFTARSLGASRSRREVRGRV
jgi:protein-export membrane protein SecD